MGLPDPKTSKATEPGGTGTAHVLEQQAGAPKCNCGASCWATNDPSITTPCVGAMNVSEDYPGIYTHYCDKHGHFDDADGD